MATHTGWKNALTAALDSVGRKLKAEGDRVYNVDGTNLMSNGGFEIASAVSPGACLGWTGFGTADAARISRSTLAARTGGYGVRVMPAAATGSAYYQHYIPSDGARVYRIRYWVKVLAGGDTAQAAGVWLGAYGTTGNLIRPIFPSDKPLGNGVLGEWRMVEQVIRFNDVGMTSLRVAFWAAGSASNDVAFDDLMIEDVTEAERVKRDVGVTALSDFGADPTGVRSSELAFRQAIAATPAGGTLRVPRGYYKRPYTNPSGEGSYIVIDKPINIVGEPGTVMENFILYFKGAFDSPIALGASANEGDRMISTSVPHGWSVGDHVQVMSQYNVYSAAAGVYQLGSVNPTYGTTPVARTGEIHRVGDVPDTTDLNLDRTLIFGGYTTDAEVRRIRTLKGVTIQGIRFVNTENVHYRGILARGCSNLVIRDCDFVSGHNQGASVRIYDSIGTRIIGGSIIKYTDTYSGSTWNTIIIGGGCTDTVIEGVYAEGGAQTIDFTPLLAGSVTADVGEPNGRTVQGMVVRNCSFRNCGDAFTTHPGTMGFFAHGNDIYGGSVGIRVRSRRSVVRNNTIRTAVAGISLSGFVHDSLVANNELIHLPSSAFPGRYAGVRYTSVSSEIDNGNHSIRAQIKGNVIVVKTGVDPASRGIELTYGIYAGYPISDVWKKRYPHITVEGNTLYGGGISVSDAINACRILNNTFQGGNDDTHRIVCLSTANVIAGNAFIDSGPHIKLGPVPVGGEYQYSTENRVGGNVYLFTPVNELVNNAPAHTD